MGTLLKELYSLVMDTSMTDVPGWSAALSALEQLSVQLEPHLDEEALSLWADWENAAHQLLDIEENEMFLRTLALGIDLGRLQSVYER